MNFSFIEMEDSNTKFYDYLSQIDKDKFSLEKIKETIIKKEKKKDELKDIFSDPIQHKIKIEFKKIQNQIIFLDYFDDQLESFKIDFPVIQFEKQNVLRLMIQKLSLAISHKLIFEIENFVEQNEVWQSRNDLIEFVSKNPDFYLIFIKL